MPVYVPLDRVLDSPFQTRSHYDPEAVAELADSIERDGQLQTPVGRLTNAQGKALLVNAHTMGEYDGDVEQVERHNHSVQLAYGHTRARAWRAIWDRRAGDLVAGAGIHGCPEGCMPVELRPLTDDAMERLAWEENERRRDLDPVDRAAAIASRIARHGWTHEEAGEALGLDRSTVSNILRWYEAFTECEVVGGSLAIASMRSGELSEAKARALAGAFVAQREHNVAFRSLGRRAGFREAGLGDLFWLVGRAIALPTAAAVRDVVGQFVDLLEAETEAERRQREPGMFDDAPEADTKESIASTKPAETVDWNRNPLVLEDRASIVTYESSRPRLGDLFAVYYPKNHPAVPEGHSSAYRLGLVEAFSEAAARHHNVEGLVETLRMLGDGTGLHPGPDVALFRFNRFDVDTEALAEHVAGMNGGEAVYLPGGWPAVVDLVTPFKLAEDADGYDDGGAGLKRAAEALDMEPFDAEEVQRQADADGDECCRLCGDWECDGTCRETTEAGDLGETAGEGDSWPRPQMPEEWDDVDGMTIKQLEETRARYALHGFVRLDKHHVGEDRRKPAQQVHTRAVLRAVANLRAAVQLTDGQLDEVLDHLGDSWTRWSTSPANDRLREVAPMPDAHWRRHLRAMVLPTLVKKYDEIAREMGKLTAPDVSAETVDDDVEDEIAAESFAASDHREATVDEVSALLDEKSKLVRHASFEKGKQKKATLAEADELADRANALLERYAETATDADVRYVCNRLGISVPAEVDVEHRGWNRRERKLIELVEREGAAGHIPRDSDLKAADALAEAGKLVDVEGRLYLPEHAPDVSTDTLPEDEDPDGLEPELEAFLEHVRVNRAEKPSHPDLGPVYTVRDTAEVIKAKALVERGWLRMVRVGLYDLTAEAEMWKAFVNAANGEVARLDEPAEAEVAA